MSSMSGGSRFPTDERVVGDSADPEPASDIAHNSSDALESVDLETLDDVVLYVDLEFVEENLKSLELAQEYEILRSIVELKGL